jgi:hypothetical protein
MPNSPRNRKARRLKVNNGAAAPAQRSPGESTQAQKQARQTPQAQHERKQRVLTRGQPAIIATIADAVTVKNVNMFFLMAPNGQVPLDDEHGLGSTFTTVVFSTAISSGWQDLLPSCWQRLPKRATWRSLS